MSDMSDLLPHVSPETIRFSIFAGVFALMALLELAIPKRRLRWKKLWRWRTNISITLIDSALVWLMAHFVIPLAAVATALYMEQHGVGLFNWLDWPLWLEVLISVIVLDFAIWLQHLASHKIPLLWDFHRMHHSDIDIDVTTAIRFHPIEIGLSMLYKMVWVTLLGPAALAVVIFEAVLNGLAMFNHANIALPGWLDRLLRLVIVTPDMHRVHHSIWQWEHDSNYGFNLSIWDRLFRTYVPQPQDGHQNMTIGLQPMQSDAPTRLLWSLTLPFRQIPDGGRRAGGGMSDGPSSDADAVAIGDKEKPERLST